MMVARMKSVVNTFVSKQQLGFVPKRLIGEATHLLKLIQAYLEETDEEGLILALDWEKAFDRVSWNYYHQVIGALGFGPNFASWAKMLANPDLPPTRRVKIAGQYSNPFEKTTPRARGGVTMAPLQLRLEPTEMVLAIGQRCCACPRRQHRTELTTGMILRPLAALLLARSLHSALLALCLSNSQSSGSCSWHGL
eukprot:scaffold10462_cov119-Isochrysis_galbana.AAC.14